MRLGTAPGVDQVIKYLFHVVVGLFQGLCVAFLFCFCNGEVLQVLRKGLVRYAASRKVGLHNRRLSSRSQQPMTTEL